MSEASPAPDLHVGPSPEQASVEPAAPAPEQAAAPAVDESAQASAAPPADAAPAAAPAVPTLEELMTELDGVRSRLQQYDDENKSLKEQLALHASSNAVDAAAALK